MTRKKLSEILAAGSDGELLRKQFSEAAQAEEFKPLPAGKYEASIVDGMLFASKINKTPGFKLVFEVIAGEFAGRRLFFDIYLTVKAMPLAKCNLAKLGVNDLKQLDSAPPPGIVCLLVVACRKDDDGIEFNRVRSFEVLRVETPAPEPFAPDEKSAEEGEAK